MDMIIVHHAFSIVQRESCKMMSMPRDPSLSRIRRVFRTNICLVTIRHLMTSGISPVYHTHVAQISPQLLKFDEKSFGGGGVE